MCSLTYAVRQSVLGVFLIMLHKNKCYLIIPERFVNLVHFAWTFLTRRLKNKWALKTVTDILVSIRIVSLHNYCALVVDKNYSFKLSSMMASFSVAWITTTTHCTATKRRG